MITLTKLINFMRIKQLRLKNFRGIKDLELNFDITQPAAALVGINGVGKSSILDSISALVRSHGLIADEYRSVFVNTDLESGTIIPTNEKLKSIFQDQDIRFGETLTCNGISVDFEGHEIYWEIEKFKEKDCHPMISDDRDSLLKGIANEYDAKRFVATYYSANRKSFEINNRLLPIHDYPESSLNKLDIIDFHEFTNWFQKLEDLENETRLSIDNNHRDIKLEATRKAIYSMLGDGYSNLRMKRAIDKLTIYKGDQEIELDWLSDGEKGLLALAGDLARRLAITYPDSSNPLKEAGLVLIDEIELHLHPAWQRIILQRLTATFPGCQFIVTTHSPQVLSNVQPECIHVLAIEDGNVVVKRPDRSYGRDSNRILEDIMGVTKRPPAIEAQILELFRVIHDGELSQAKKMIQDLATEIGMDEPELIRAASTIHRREVIGR
jgi:predicted ATP-binding protein involved in virulence